MERLPGRKDILVQIQISTLSGLVLKVIVIIIIFENILCYLNNENTFLFNLFRVEISVLNFTIGTVAEII